MASPAGSGFPEPTREQVEELAAFRAANPVQDMGWYQAPQPPSDQDRERAYRDLLAANMGTPAELMIKLLKETHRG